MFKLINDEMKIVHTHVDVHTHISHGHKSEPSPKCVNAADLFKRKCSWLWFVGPENQNNTIEHCNITHETFYSNFLFEQCNLLPSTA